MMSYPLEKDKGKAFGIFWAIFQFGSFIGSIIALAINIRSGSLSAVSTSTYIVSAPNTSVENTAYPAFSGFPHHHLRRHRLRIPRASAQPRRPS